MILRGLVLKQPWASACIGLGKDCENRGRPLSHRGPLVIVAGANRDREYYASSLDFIRSIGADWTWPHYDTVKRGGIIGCVDMYDVATPDQYPVSKWHMPGQYGYRIRKAVELPFRRLKGHQGLMRIEMTPREISAIRAGGIALETP
jgi:hypothetical protein